jgi:Bacteriophage HK97-gp10, putative tail-component
MAAQDAFVLDINRFIEKAKNNMAAAMKKLAFELLTRIVYHTPVDTGRLRGNWQLTFDVLGYQVTDLTDSIGTQVLGTAMDRLRAVTGSLAGHSIWLANHLPYAIPIEYGHSRIKAPSGMVRVSISEISGPYGIDVTELSTF